MHRRAIAQMAELHFAPTEMARAALTAEGIAPGTIHVTGNTGIDALLATSRAMARTPGLRAMFARTFAMVDPTRALVLATMHRRENHGRGISQFIAALRELATTEAVDIVLPMHPHPAVGAVIEARLGDVRGVHLVPPLDYPAFIHLLGEAHLVLTDSGGIQEEAPAFGVPVLVMRDVTERPEGVSAGVAQIVGTDRTAIVAAVRALLHDKSAYARMARAVLPYGDGRATDRAIAVLDRVYGGAEPGMRMRANRR
jgi:UDP-N-acetylglucosamine 2-epimerase (non-hydrolysing)